MDKEVKNTRYMIGIDEVGRGPIAGPVAVCAFLVKDESFLGFPTSPTGGKITGQTGDENNREIKKLPKLRDSKKLSKKQREEWFEYLKIAKTEGFCDFSVSFVSSENIDKFGIAKCIQKALDESLEKVTQLVIPFMRSSDEGDGSGARPSQKVLQVSLPIFLDGGLHAPKEYINQETIIKGDELHPVISLASIVAKVSRDRVMEKYGKEYPEYGFEKHSGYGTRAHFEAIKRHGQTPIHRKTFIH